MTHMYARDDSGESVPVRCNDEGDLTISQVYSDKGAFGGISTFSNVNRSTMKFTTGFINTDIYDTRTTNFGSVSVEGSSCKITNDVNPGDFAEISSKKSVSYQSGVGVGCIFAGRFNAGVLGSEQTFGVGNTNAGLFFGYNGEDFGIMKRTDGKREIQSFQVTTASSSTGTVDVELDGETFNILLTDASGDLNFTAYELASGSYDGWDVMSRDDKVYFSKKDSGVCSGAFSYNAGTTSSAGTFTQTQLGVAKTEDWILQTAWNVDKLDGAGPSGMTLVPTNQNVYKIQYQWLGAGNMNFFVENPENGQLNLVHKIKYPNSSTSVSLSDPNMKMIFTVRSLTSTVALSAYINSSAHQSEGNIAEYSFLAGSAINTLTNISATTETAVLSIRNNFVSAYDLKCEGTVYLKKISINSDSNKGIVFKIYKNASIGGFTTTDYPAWAVNNFNGIVDLDLNAITAGGTSSPLISIAVGKVGSKVIDISDLKITLSRGETASITAETSNSTNEITASLIYHEEV